MACPFLLNMLLWDIHFLLGLSKELQQTSESSGLGWINVPPQKSELAVPPRVRATCLATHHRTQPATKQLVPCGHQSAWFWGAMLLSQGCILSNRYVPVCHVRWDWLNRGFRMTDGHYEASSSTATDPDHRCTIAVDSVTSPADVVINSCIFATSFSTINQVAAQA